MENEVWDDSVLLKSFSVSEERRKAHYKEKAQSGATSFIAGVKASAETRKMQGGGESSTARPAPRDHSHAAVEEEPTKAKRPLPQSEANGVPHKRPFKAASNSAAQPDGTADQDAAPTSSNAGPSATKLPMGNAYGGGIMPRPPVGSGPHLGDAVMEELLMAWYFAGYYSGFYAAQNQLGEGWWNKWSESEARGGAFDDQMYDPTENAEPSDLAHSNMGGADYEAGYDEQGYYEYPDGYGQDPEGNAAYMDDVELTHGAMAPDDAYYQETYQDPREMHPGRLPHSGMRRAQAPISAGQVHPQRRPPPPPAQPHRPPSGGFSQLAEGLSANQRQPVARLQISPRRASSAVPPTSGNDDVGTRSAQSSPFPGPRMRSPSSDASGRNQRPPSQPMRHGPHSAGTVPPRSGTMQSQGMFRRQAPPQQGMQVPNEAGAYPAARGPPPNPNEAGAYPAARGPPPNPNDARGAAMANGEFRGQPNTRLPQGGSRINPPGNLRVSAMENAQRNAPMAIDGDPRFSTRSQAVRSAAPPQRPAPNQQRQWSQYRQDPAANDDDGSGARAQGWGHRPPRTASGNHQNEQARNTGADHFLWEGPAQVTSGVEQRVTKSKAHNTLHQSAQDQWHGYEGEHGKSFDIPHETPVDGNSSKGYHHASRSGANGNGVRHGSIDEHAKAPVRPERDPKYDGSAKAMADVRSFKEWKAQRWAAPADSQSAPAFSERSLSRTNRQNESEQLSYTTVESEPLPSVDKKDVAGSHGAAYSLSGASRKPSVPNGKNEAEHLPYSTVESQPSRPFDKKDQPVIHRPGPPRTTKPTLSHPRPAHQAHLKTVKGGQLHIPCANGYDIDPVNRNEEYAEGGFQCLVKDSSMGSRRPETKLGSQVKISLPGASVSKAAAEADSAHIQVEDKAEVAQEQTKPSESAKSPDGAKSGKARPPADACPKSPKGANAKERKRVLSPPKLSAAALAPAHVVVYNPKDIKKGHKAEGIVVASQKEVEVPGNAVEDKTNGNCEVEDVSKFSGANDPEAERNQPDAQSTVAEDRVGTLQVSYQKPPSDTADAPSTAVDDGVEDSLSPHHDVSSNELDAPSVVADEGIKDQQVTNQKPRSDKLDASSTAADDAVSDSQATNQQLACNELDAPRTAVDDGAKDVRGTDQEPASNAPDTPNRAAGDSVEDSQAANQEPASDKPDALSPVVDNGTEDWQTTRVDEKDVSVSMHLDGQNVTGAASASTQGDAIEGQTMPNRSDLRVAKEKAYCRKTRSAMVDDGKAPTVEPLSNEPSGVQSKGSPDLEVVGVRVNQARGPVRTENRRSSSTRQMSYRTRSTAQVAYAEKEFAAEPIQLPDSLHVMRIADPPTFMPEMVRPEKIRYRVLKSMKVRPNGPPLPLASDATELTAPQKKESPAPEKTASTAPRKTASTATRKTASTAAKKTESNASENPAPKELTNIKLRIVRRPIQNANRVSSDMLKVGPGLGSKGASFLDNLAAEEAAGARKAKAEADARASAEARKASEEAQKTAEETRQYRAEARRQAKVLRERQRRAKTKKEREIENGDDDEGKGSKWKAAANPMKRTTSQKTKEGETNGPAGEAPPAPTKKPISRKRSNGTAAPSGRKKIAVEVNGRPTPLSPGGSTASQVSMEFEEILGDPAAPAPPPNNPEFDNLFHGLIDEAMKGSDDKPEGVRSSSPSSSRLFVLILVVF